MGLVFDGYAIMRACATDRTSGAGREFQTRLSGKSIKRGRQRASSKPNIDCLHILTREASDGRDRICKRT